jgi:hypothetical protein
LGLFFFAVSAKKIKEKNLRELCASSEAGGEKTNGDKCHGKMDERLSSKAGRGPPGKP